ncbi:hypothetical protein K503DRAFT_803725 [Rhizopogon vinicolor AM-OR11-026]|uniref:Uncharacterized protein n=1 Tax=Rhizopogon vinicolor AM-OR11-026 TaxID=1314800 RepID=A0A1B7MNT7_9AGAM|nr:hypothetical protein K503DRAFT_803725 [Rhizopogon vinicolor AM-OR11-026]
MASYPLIGTPKEVVTTSLHSYRLQSSPSEKPRSASRTNMRLAESRSTPPSTPSSQPVVERCTWLINDRGMMRSTLGHAYSDQDSLTSTSQAFLECLDRYGHHGRLNGAYEGIIRICLAEILANFRSEATMLNEDLWKYHNTDLQTTFGVEPHTPVALDEATSLSSTDFSIPPLPSTLWHLQGQEYGHLSQESVGVAGTQSEEIDPAFS